MRDTMVEHIFIGVNREMPETAAKKKETVVVKPKCMRCGTQHTVSDLGLWMPGWWTCQLCNIRWEEDEFDED